jgi:hypothetical protein
MKLASILVLTVCTASSALAATNVTWVASYGTNNATCSRALPCDTFGNALAATSADGVIKVVDAGEYGPVGIAQNLTIDGNGTAAEIEAGGGFGIYINNPGGQVTIRSLTIRSSSVGVEILGGDVHLENLLIVGAPQVGVDANGSSNPVHLTAKNVTVTNASTYGIHIAGASASLRDSVIRGNSYGIFVGSSPGHAAVALVERCELSYNGTGLYATDFNGAGTTVRVSDSVITANTTGIATAFGGQIITFRTNMLAGNPTDGSTPFSISLK